jgi:hypothetical protein
VDLYLRLRALPYASNTLRDGAKGAQGAPGGAYFLAASALLLIFKKKGYLLLPFASSSRQLLFIALRDSFSIFALCCRPSALQIAGRQGSSGSADQTQDAAQKIGNLVEFSARN